MLCGRIFVGSKLLVASRPSTFRLPQKPTVPVIMVGAGTGIAPFRGFVREFHAEAGLRAKTMLIFGCQKGTEDFLYKEELNEALQPQEGKPKVVADGGHLYVCGSVAMGAAIRECLGETLGSAD